MYYRDFRKRLPNLPAAVNLTTLSTAQIYRRFFSEFFIPANWMNVCLTFDMRYHKFPHGNTKSPLILHTDSCRTIVFLLNLLHINQQNMTTLPHKFLEIESERKYSVKEACLFLGIHRCTIYGYINNPERPLPFIRLHTDKRGILFLGSDLIAYKAAGLPKRGRKFKNGGSK